MRVKVVITLALTMAIAGIAIPASANLVSTVFGFPVITQSGVSNAFNQYTANAADKETVSASLPLEVSGLKMGAPQAGKIHLLGFNFDSINGNAMFGQSSNQAVDSTKTNFAQTSESSNFAYPFSGVGAVSLPGFGFGP